MALVICPECQTQISEHAPQCPTCGNPGKKPSQTMPASGTGPRRSRKRKLLVGCLVAPFAFVVLWIVVGGTIFTVKEHQRHQHERSQAFTRIALIEIAEADIHTQTKIGEFRPRESGKPVRVTLTMFPYVFEASEPGDFWFHPKCELLIFRETSGFLRQTSVAGSKTFPRAPPVGTRTLEEYKRLRSAGIREMQIEFTPEDSYTYWVEFKGPPKGFKKYHLLVEQQGL